MSVLGMAAVPFALRKTRSPLEWFGILAFGLGLAGFNYTMAMDMAGAWQNAKTAPAALAASKAAALNSRIAHATVAKGQLPPLPQTSAAEVAAAEQAVALAEVDADKECVIVKDNCRARQADVRSAVEARSKVLAARSATEKREALDAEIAVAQGELDALGPVPKVVDPWSARLARLISLVRPTGADAVAEWYPSFTAFIIEMIAMWLPRVLLTATEPVAPGKPGPRLWQRRPKAAAPVDEEVAPAVPAPVAVVETAAVRPTPSTPARPKKPAKISPAAVGGADSVRQWKECRTGARPGSEIKPKRTYETSYLPWCKEQGIEPVSFTRFGSIMKGELGVTYIERNKRGFYVGITLLSTPRLAVAN
jgi:hypothetical protein